MKHPCLLAGALLCLALGDSARAVSPQALRLSATDALPQIDGRLDDPAWQRAPLHERFEQYLPEDRQPARWRTTVQVLADADALVFGIRAYDDAPAQIRAPLTRRDQVRRDQDFVSVVLDPVGLRRSAQFVRINAAGVLADGVFTAEDDVEDFAPDFEVQAAVQRLPDGYSVELRWPLATLRFPYIVCPQAAEVRRLPPEGDKEAWDGPAPPCGGADWRLMVTRSVPREASYLLVSAPLSSDALNFIAELQPIAGLGDLVETVRERGFLSLRPELTLRRGSRPSLGAELKYRPRADWVLDATLNPDFSQVELDTPQLAGNTRFALSVPEKRTFFLESTDIVGQSLPDASGSPRALAAFYSRAITDPDWGLRATWRGAQAQATLMSLRDAGGGQVLRAHAYGTEAHAQRGGSQASFARGRLHRGPLALGALASRRDYGGGRSNTVLGGDLGWQLGAEDLLRGHLLLSSSTAGFAADGAEQATRAEAGHNLWLSWHRRSEDWSNTGHYEEISARFANDNGFVPQSGLRRASLQLKRRLGGQELGALSLFDLELDLKLEQTQALADARHGVPGGEVLERLLQPGFWFSAARNTEVWGHLGLDRRRARSGGALHGLRTLNLGFGANPAPWLNYLGAELELGRRLDVEADRVGRGAWLLLEAKLRGELPRGWWLEFEQHLEQGWVRDPQGRRAVSDLAAQSRAVLHFSVRDSLRLIGQNSRLQRRSEALLEGADERGRHVSLVFQHRLGLSRILSLGLTRANDQGLRQTELFAKAVLAYSR